MSTYNGEKYLKEQIESILSQSVPVEIVVRDDGSTDSTQQILDEYSKKGKLTWYSGNNLGPGKSFFSLVQGAPFADYYAFADQDDVWDYDKVEVAIGALANLSQDIPNLYCSSCRLVSADLRPLPVALKSRVIVPSLGEALVENISPGCTYIFNRKSLELFRMYKMDFISVHDWDLYRIVLSLAGNVIYDKQPHISYRQHGKNAIGYQTGRKLWWRRIKKIVTGTTKRQYSTTAQYLKEQYIEIIPESNLYLINLLINTRHGMLNKMQYVFSNKIHRYKTLDNVIFKFLAILGLL